MASSVLSTSVAQPAAALNNGLLCNVSELRASAAPRLAVRKYAGARAQVKSSKEAKVAAASFGMIAGLAAAQPAKALETQEIVDAVQKVEAFATQAAEVATQAYETAKAITDTVVEASSPFVEAAAPVVSDATRKAISAAVPIATDVAAKATKALSDSGVEIKPVVDAAKNAASVAGDYTEKTVEIVSPYASSTLESVLAQDPTLLAIGGAGLLFLYIATPAFFGGLAYAARGYSGEFTAAQALDLLTKEDYTLIDVRTDSQKVKSGVPSLPKNARKKLVSVPVDEVASKLRNNLRNVRKVEAEITAIKIGALKRLGKGSKIILIDAYGDTAKLVAQSLANLGFKNTWVVKDGVDGSTGWVQSQLATETAGSSLAEVLSPSRIISGTFAGKSGTLQVANSKRKFLLPSSASKE